MLSDWVRITIKRSGRQDVLTVRELEDDWYRRGGGFHPEQRQQVRNKLAAAELQDWLYFTDPPSGEYQIRVFELHRDSGATDHLWAHVRLTHARHADPGCNKWDVVA